MLDQIHPLHHATELHVSELTSALEDTRARVFGLYLVNCSSMAARAWLVWDVLITMQDEVEILWRMRWTFTKFLYYFIRYGGVLLQVVSLWSNGDVLDLKKALNEANCSVRDVVYRTMTSYFFTIALEYILLLRVYALYARYTVRRRLIRGFFYVVAAVMLASAAIFILRTEHNRPCHHVASYPAIYAHVAASYLFQLTLLCLTLAPILCRNSRTGLGKSPLTNLLARDGTWSFVAVLVTNLIYAVLLQFAHPSMHHLLFNWIIGAYSFIGYRNLLNILSLSSRHRKTTLPTAMLSTLPPDTLTLDEYELQMGVTTRDD